MFDFKRCDPALLDSPRRVLDALVDQYGVAPAEVLLVGARCRDLLHSAFGHRSVISATTDVDLGLALPDWVPFDRLERELTRLGDSGVRFLVAGVPVDLLPFGAVELPPGSATPRHRGVPVDVAGFEAVYRRGSRDVAADLGLPARLAMPEGYTLLKLKAWADRSVRGEYKDGKDLAVACYWRCEDAEQTASLWEDADGLRLLEEAGFDQDLAAVRRLGQEVATLVDPAVEAAMRTAWQEADVRLLAQHFRFDHWPGDFERRLELVEALAEAAGLAR